MEDLGRPILLVREGGTFRLTFAYDKNLVERMRELPYAHFDGDTRSWTTSVCKQSVDRLRQMHYQGLTDVPVDTLLHEGEDPEPCPDAILRPGTPKRPFVVLTATRNDTLYAKLRSIPGSQWEAKLGGVSYGQHAAAALVELVSRGVLTDPEKLLQPADVTVTFDSRSGSFIVSGDPRAQVAFDAHFPNKDAVELWKSRGIDVAFGNDLSEEIYRGEIARVGPGLQPEGMLTDLFPHQKTNIAIAVERSGIGIFDTPGVGKTASAIGTGFEVVVNRQEVPRVVVVVPGAVRSQWKQEIERFTGCTDVVVIDGDKKKRLAAYEAAKDARWMIVNYDVLHLDYKLIAPLVSGAFLVLDEAHRIKSPTSKRTKASRQLAQRAAKRMALSGTPVENEPGEWYSLISGFVMPGVFGTPQDFLGRYQYPGRFGGYEGARNLPELRDRSRVHYVRHTKAQVAKHLPPLRVQHMPLDPDAAYLSALKRAHKEAAEEIKQAAAERTAKNAQAKGTGVSADQWETLEAGAEMTAVGMLRLMCSSPRLVVESDSPAAEALRKSGLIPEVDGPKLEELLEMSTEMQASGDRLVVFTFSKKMANLISKRYKEHGIRHVLFTGDTNTADRDAAVTAFTTPGTEADPGPTVFVATDAGAEGLNLGRCCSTLVNFDVPWKASTLEQRSNRIHRIDGTSPHYLVINMTLSHTIEQGILKMVEVKADLADAVFGEKGGRKKITGRPGRSSLIEDAFKEYGSIH